LRASISAFCASGTVFEKQLKSDGLLLYNIVLECRSNIFEGQWELGP